MESSNGSFGLTWMRAMKLGSAYSTRGLLVSARTVFSTVPAGTFSTMTSSASTRSTGCAPTDRATGSGSMPARSLIRTSSTTNDCCSPARIDLLALPPGDDLRYVTGFSPLADERACYLFVASDRALFVVPELNAVQAERYVHVPFLTYTDAAGPSQALASARDSLGSRRRIAPGDTMRADILLLLQRFWPDAEYVPASEVLAPLRMRKSPDEIALLERAAQTADRAVEAAWQALAAGQTESTVARAGEEGFRQGEGAEVTLTIVA